MSLRCSRNFETSYTVGMDVVISHQEVYSRIRYLFDTSQCNHMKFYVLRKSDIAFSSGKPSFNATQSPVKWIYCFVYFNLHGCVK